MIKRRDFIPLLGGAAVAAWPLAARAQPERIRRIGILWPQFEADPDSQSRIASLRQALKDLGWSEGRNLRFDYRWGASADDRDRIRRYAIELVALAPDVIVAGSGGIAIELKSSRTRCAIAPSATARSGGGSSPRTAPSPTGR